MKGLRVLAALLAAVGFVPLACAQSKPAPADYAGTWILRLGARVFGVLTLEVKDNRLTGTWRSPKEYSGNSVAAISRISRETVSDSVTAVLEHEGLRVIREGGDRDEYRVTLRDADTAWLEPAEFATDRLLLRRHRTGEVPAVATDWDPARSYSQVELSDVSNPEMKRIFEEDQKPRQNFAAITPKQWEEIARGDAARRTRTHQLLAEGKLNTGEDFYYAAFLFQHGDSPEDYLMAHTLGMVAVARGNPGGLWIATAAMDRYLQSIGKAQVFGTQFLTPPEGKVTQGEYNRELVPDSLRRVLGVPSIATQQRQAKRMQEQADAARK